MRLLLWVLLMTLVTLLASADADASKIANADSTMTSKLDSIQARALLARALSAEFNADGKRSLRVHDNGNGGGESYTGEEDEERAISISSILDKIKTFLGNFTKRMVVGVTKKINKWNGDLAMQLYKKGETPISLQAKGWGSKNKKAMAFYKEWYDTNVKAGVIKALD
ncbi:RxLR effector protein Avrblb1 [Phytophthora ramorum]|uniref:RxLR effector protein Avrblb1 n=1 Tax=Phytophthora ramorum TaxID=164328 RepID=UPI0030979EBC|nr:RxLR effector protein Avrblb1 [Phytophthora ramorum]